VARATAEPARSSDQPAKLSTSLIAAMTPIGTSTQSDASTIAAVRIASHGATTKPTMLVKIRLHPQTLHGAMRSRTRA
jgi:hypothetical protein